MNICFRLDANNFIGLGHLKRCLQLALDLKYTNKKFNIFFILKKNKERYEQTLREKGFKVHLIDNYIDDSKQTKKILEKEYCQNLVLDHYYLGLTWEKKIKKIVKRLIIISDYFRKNYGDLIIVQNFKREIESKKILSGKKYYIINRIYRAKRKKTRKIPEKKTLLVNYGSYDIKNLTCKTIKFFLKNFEEININVIIDKSFRYKSQLQRLTKNKKNIKVFSNLDSLADITNRANFCIGSGGIHNFERIFLGKLSFVVRTDYSQKINIDFLKKKKLIIYLGTANKFSLNKIKKSQFTNKNLTNFQKKLFDFFPNNFEYELSNFLEKKIYEKL